MKNPENFEPIQQDETKIEIDKNYPTIDDVVDEVLAGDTTILERAPFDQKKIFIEILVELFETNRIEEANKFAKLFPDVNYDEAYAEASKRLGSTQVEFPRHF